MNPVGENRQDFFVKNQQKTTYFATLRFSHRP